METAAAENSQVPGLNGDKLSSCTWNAQIHCKAFSLREHKDYPQNKYIPFYGDR